MANERKVDPVLDPNQYAFVSDQTNGIIKTYVGPCKLSLTDTEMPKIFNPETKSFETVDVYEAMQKFVIAPKGWYVILKNPPKDASMMPIPRKANDPTELRIGLKVNIPGPVAFALWPGQITRLVEGHDLRTNQYLLVRVYDDVMAQADWEKAIIKKRVDNGEGGSDNPPAGNDLPNADGTPVPAKPAQHVDHDADEKPELVTGKLMIIKGTDVSFYIPPSGIAVVPDEEGNLVRDAETLERLDYCVLLDESGNKRYVRGPAVVFPRPTERFLIDKEGNRKFPAIELNEISGLYIKVIAPYKDGENGKEYKAGDELFITGKEQAIYFPRQEHAIIKYGDKDVHYAVAIPPGEARYVMDRAKGTIVKDVGPAMLLPDPRTQVIVRRILDKETVQLWYPGNAKALQYNQALQEIADSIPEKDKLSNVGVNYLDQTSLMNFSNEMPSRGVESASTSFRGMSPPAKKKSLMFGDDIDRKTKYNPPRTITLDTKFEGVPKIVVWPGYAVQVVSSSGERKVVVGPNPVFLEYDETLSAMELSTGKPKTTDKLQKIAYLRVIGNKVSDIVNVETRDLCEASVKVSYRVNFEGEPNTWFNLENYVKFLCDHVRSRIKRVVRKCSIENFYSDAIDIIRDAVLGASKKHKRPGLLFEENGMRVYDVEVLSVDIKDPAISEMLLKAQTEVIKTTISTNQQQKNLEATKIQEQIKRETQQESTNTAVAMETLARQLAETKHETSQLRLGLETETITKEHTVELERIQRAYDREKEKLGNDVKKQEELKKVHDSEILRIREKHEVDNLMAMARVENALREMMGAADADAKRLGAVQGELIAALQALADAGILKSMEGMAPLAIVQGTSLVGALTQLFEGTPLAGTLAKLTSTRNRA
jgi:major vault protein